MFFPRRLLIIDDEPRLTALVRDAFASTGRYLIKEENRSLRALHSARHFQPDLILLDVMMPDLDGREVARQLRDDPALKDVPIVFVTSLAPNGVIGVGRLFRRLLLCGEAVSDSTTCSTASTISSASRSSSRRAKSPNESLRLVGSGSSASLSPWSRRLQ